MISARVRAILMLLSVVLLVASITVSVGEKPAMADPAAPLASYSYYMGTVDQSTLYNLGYSYGQDVAAGELPQTSLIVLAWGSPYCNGTTCGTYLTGGSGSFESTASERAASEQFGEGFYFGTDTDTSAVAFIAMGMTNSDSWFGDSTNNYYNATHDGDWWAGTVTDGENWFSTNGYATQVQMRGAIDAELDWNLPVPTQDWAAGYDSNGTTYYYDYGDAAGCPPFGTCDNTWLQHGVWTMSYGATFAEPLPEIPNNSAAEEWGQIADYAWDSLDDVMSFLGPDSQYQACIDTGNPCTGQDDTPDQSWDQLYNGSTRPTGASEPALS